MTVIFNGVDPVADILDTFRTLLESTLTATPGGTPKRVIIGHGDGVTLDANEMAWIRPVRIYPSTEQFGQEDIMVMPRTIFQWAVDVELGVVRCTATLQSANNQPILPSADAVTADSARILADCRAMRHVVQYLYPGRRKTLVRPWQPTVSAGGTAGGTITVAVPFNDCAPTIS